MDYNKISFSTKTCKESENNGYKWFPYNKGGSFKKWWGNQDYVINYEENGFELKNFKKSVIRNPKFYFKESLSWSKISSGKIAFRYYPDGFIFDVAGCSIFPNNNIFYILGFLNSNISNKILDFISPTLNYEVGHVSSLPLIINNKFHEIIVNLVNDNVDLCKWDWDDYEVSWNFKKHPLLKSNKNLISKSYEQYKNLKKEEFNKLKQNEIKLNKIFSEIYNINTDCSVDDKYISIHLANYEKDIKSFISYAVGCMFGRYSLNKEGLICTNEKLDLNNYNEFIPDEDNIIPILDTEYFDDDIVGRFIEFIKICFGEKHLEENLDFIAKGLNKKEKTSREIIREYFIKDFFKDHTKTYNKHPIYWQFDSGKQNGFKCLIYIHRYNPNLLSKIRTDYLHKTQKAIEESMTNYTNIKENSELKSEVKEATKNLNKLNKQLDETKKYDEILGHLANQKIEIDLDDGVKANYAKFQNIQTSNNNKKQNLLKKI